GLQRIDGGNLLRRVEAAPPLRNSERRRDRRNRRWLIARQDAQVEAALRQRPRYRRRIGPQLLAHREYGAAIAVGERDHRRAWLEIGQRARGVGDTTERATAKAGLYPADQGAHALPRFLNRAFVWHPVVGLSRHRRSQWVAARQREPGGLFDHVR